MVVDGSCVRSVCKAGSGLGPVVTEPLGQGHCTLSCKNYLFIYFLERKSEESSMHEVILLGSYFATQLVDNV